MEDGGRFLIHWSPVRIGAGAQENTEEQADFESGVHPCCPPKSPASAAIGTPEVQPEPCRMQVGGGLFVLLDPEDFAAFGKHSWHANRAHPRNLYPRRTIRLGRGRKAKKGSVFLHREIMQAPKGVLVDHRDGNPLNCQRSNLRLCTARENSANVVRSKLQKNGGFKGVSWHPKAKKWQAQIAAGEPRANGKRKIVYLGLFTNPADAARAYDAAAVKAFGEFAALNFPIETTEVRRGR